LREGEGEKEKKGISGKGKGRRVAEVVRPLKSLPYVGSTKNQSKGGRGRGGKESRAQALGARHYLLIWLSSRWNRRGEEKGLWKKGREEKTGRSQSHIPEARLSYFYLFLQNRAISDGRRGKGGKGGREKRKNAADSGHLLDFLFPVRAPERRGKGGAYWGRQMQVQCPHLVSPFLLLVRRHLSKKKKNGGGGGSGRGEGEERGEYQVALLHTAHTSRIAGPGPGHARESLGEKGRRRGGDRSSRSVPSMLLNQYTVDVGDRRGGEEKKGGYGKKREKKRRKFSGRHPYKSSICLS